MCIRQCSIKSSVYTLVNVTNVKCNTLYVRIFISILVFSNLYIRTVTVRFHFILLPHCETNDRLQLPFNAYLSVPHSFKEFNLNCDAIGSLKCKICLLHYSALIWTPAFCWRENSVEGTAVRRSLRIYKTVKTIITILSFTFIKLWLRFLILQGKANWLN